MSETGNLDTLEKIILYSLVTTSIITAVIYISFSSAYFFGDDFELIAQAINGTSLFNPISSHLRPVVRAHFILLKFTNFSPLFSHFFSFILHIIASASFFLFLRSIYGEKIAYFSSILFFSIYRADEAVFWISASGILYCFIFSFLSIYFYNRKKFLLSAILLIMAIFSYELWIIVPLGYILLKKEKFLKYLSLFLTIPYATALFLTKSNVLQSYGGFSLKHLPVKTGIYLWRTLSPFGSLPANWVFILLSLTLVIYFTLLIFKKKENFFFPILLYLVPTAIFSFSSIIPSRFYYFPVAAIVIFLFIGLRTTAKEPKIIIFLVIVYLIFISPLILYLDSIDYKNFSNMHKKIISEAETALSVVNTGDVVEFTIGKFPDYPKKFIKSLRGTLKPVFVRQRAVAHLIYPQDIVTLVLFKKGLSAKFLPCGNNLQRKKIHIGNFLLVNRICFKVIPR